MLQEPEMDISFDRRYKIKIKFTLYSFKHNNEDKWAREGVANFF